MRVSEWLRQWQISGEIIGPADPDPELAFWCGWLLAQTGRVATTMDERRERAIKFAEFAERRASECTAFPQPSAPPVANEQEPVGIGDAAWCLAKQALDEKWSDAKLGPAIAQFAIIYRQDGRLAGLEEAAGIVKKWNFMACSDADGLIYEIRAAAAQGKGESE